MMTRTIVPFVVILGFGCGCKKDKPAAATTPPQASKAVAPAKAAGPQSTQAPATAPSSGLPVVELTTDLGKILIELDEAKAPITVKNFLRYVDEKFYDGTIFHRVIGNFMIQGGGFTEAFEQKQTHEPIQNEANNGLKNARGTIAMARTNDPNSATAQFFISVVDNAMLDHQGPQNFGYAVFGKVIQGMDVVDKIKSVPTTTRSPHANVPSQNLVIRSVNRAAAQ